MHRLPAAFGSVRRASPMSASLKWPLATMKIEQLGATSSLQISSGEFPPGRCRAVGRWPSMPRKLWVTRIARRARVRGEHPAGPGQHVVRGVELDVEHQEVQPAAVNVA